MDNFDSMMSEMRGKKPSRTTPTQTPDAEGTQAHTAPSPTVRTAPAQSQSALAGMPTRTVRRQPVQSADQVQADGHAGMQAQAGAAHARSEGIQTPTPYAERAQASHTQTEAMQTPAQADTESDASSPTVSLINDAGMPTVRHQKGTPVKRSRKKARIHITSRDMEILTFAAIARVISSEYAELWLRDTPYADSTVAALGKRMRELAQHGYLRAFHPSNRQGLVYASTVLGNGVCGHENIPVHSMRSTGLETSLPHALLITKVVSDYAEFIRSGEWIAVPDAAIKKAAAQNQEDFQHWVPRWDENSCPIGDAGDLALRIPQSKQHHIPDLVLIEAASNARIYIEVECSAKARIAFERMTSSYLDSQVPVEWIVGNVTAQSKPNGYIFNRLSRLRDAKGLDHERFMITYADMKYATPQPSRWES